MWIIINILSFWVWWYIGGTIGLVGMIIAVFSMAAIAAEGSHR